MKVKKPLQFVTLTGENGTLQCKDNERLKLCTVVTENIYVYLHI